MGADVALFAELSPALGVLSAAISVIALVVSFFTLWVTYFRPFKPVFLLSPLTVRFFHYQQEHSVPGINEQGRVVPSGVKKFLLWSPTLDLGINVYNSGVRPGRLTDLRIRMQSTDLSFDFHPDYIQDSTKLDALKLKKANPPADPFEVRKATEKSAWLGLLVPKDKPIQEFLVFSPEIHGLSHVPSGTFTFIVEYFSEAKRRWIQIGEYELEIPDWIKALLEDGDGITVRAKQPVSPPQNDKVDRNKLIVDEEIMKAVDKAAGIEE